MAAPATQYIPLLIFIPLIYRMFQVYSMEAQPAPGDFTSSPLTLAIFGLLAGYYVTYAIGLVRWRHRTEAIDV